MKANDLYISNLNESDKWFIYFENRIIIMQHKIVRLSEDYSKVEKET